MQVPLVTFIACYLCFAFYNQVYTDAKIICKIGLISRTHYCKQPERNTTVWAALPRLIESQVAGLEAISTEARGNEEIVIDLTEARVLSVDLVNVVRSSDLDYNVELAGLIQQFADDALTVSRDLQRLSAKIASSFDQ